MTPAPRTQRSILDPSLVKIVCATLTFVSLGCALLAFALACHLFGSSAPCPDRLTIGAFGAAGALLAQSVIFLIIVCRKKSRLNKEARLEDLPRGSEEESGAHYKKKFSGDGGGDNVKISSAGSADAPRMDNGTEDTFDMTQKSADVSYWIEQQKSEVPSTSNTFPLEHTDGATNHLSDNEDEMTAL